MKKEKTENNSVVKLEKKYDSLSSVNETFFPSEKELSQEGVKQASGQQEVESFNLLHSILNYQN